MISWSPASAWSMVTWAGRPLTSDPRLPIDGRLMASSPSVPLTMTVSAWPSPRAAERAAEVDRHLASTSVPVRSLTTMLSAPPRALKSMRSTSLRSIVMLATSRVKRTRPPLAEMSMFSAMLAPLKIERVDAVLALDHVAAVARVPVERVVAGAQQGDVVAAAADDEVVAVAAEQRCRRPALPMIMSLPAPPSRVS